MSLGALGGLVIVVVMLINNPLQIDSTGALIASATLLLALAASAGAKWAAEMNDKARCRWRNHKLEQDRAARQRSAKGESTKELAAKRRTASPLATSRPTDPPKPEPRLVRDAEESEELTAEWIRYMGWSNAHPTVTTGDNGIDVVGKEPSLGVVAAQVKFEAKKNGRPAIQGLYGAGHGIAADHWLFPSSAGYSPMAVDWANKMQVGLFHFTLGGAIEPIDMAGKQYMFQHHIPQ